MVKTAAGELRYLKVSELLEVIERAYEWHRAQLLEDLRVLDLRDDTKIQALDDCLAQKGNRGLIRYLASGIGALDVIEVASNPGPMPDLDGLGPDELFEIACEVANIRLVQLEGDSSDPPPATGPGNASSLRTTHLESVTPGN